LELAGLAGDDESRAFDRLPPVPGQVTDELWRITHEEMLPALQRADCGAFGESVYQFGRLAGECFAAVQGGPFADVATERLVEYIRDFGIPGVGQSSWGPTIYTITSGDDAASNLVACLKSRPDADCYEISIARPDNTGATIDVSL
jgi:predicted sugar kinase